MTKSSLLGGTATGTTAASQVASDPKQPDQENKGNAPETPVTQIHDPEVESGGDTGSGEDGSSESDEDQSYLEPVFEEETKPVIRERRIRPMTEAEYDEYAGIEQEPEIFAAYKHRAVRHFKVGPFEFHNNILYVTTEAQNEAFLDAWEGLPARDQNDIVVYDWKAAQRVEQPVRATRSALATRDIKDAKTIR